MRVERVPPERWREISDWDEVVAAAAMPSVFLTRDWISAWWDSFGDGLEPCLLRLAQGDETQAIAPFYLQRLPGGARRLGLLGDQVVGSEYLGLATRAGAETKAARAVSAWLRESAPSWHLVDLSGMRERDPAADALCTALRDVTGHSEAEDDPCVAIDLPDDYETYLAGLSSKFRQRLRQRTNKLLRTCEVRFFPTAAVEDLDEHLGLLFAMHQRRWELEKRVGAFADPRMREFYRKAATSLLAADRLWFWHLEVDGVIRASQFAFAYDGVLHSLQECYDIDFSLPGVSGLGVILRGRVLRAAIEAGLSKYDFLGGEEEHKLRWGARRHTVRRFRAARHGIGGRAAWLTTVAGERVRERAKALIPDAALEQLRVARDQRRRKRLAAGTRQAGSRSD